MVMIDIKLVGGFLSLSGRVGKEILDATAKASAKQISI